MQGLTGITLKPGMASRGLQEVNATHKTTTLHGELGYAPKLYLLLPTLYVEHIAQS